MTTETNSAITIAALTPTANTEGKKYKLQSGPMVHVPGLFRYWQHMTSQGERRKAFGMALAAFPTLPGELLFDLLDGRVATAEDTRENLVFEWSGALGALDEYLYDWKALTFTTDGAKLTWMETMLADWNPLAIPTRRMKQTSRTAPRLEVPVESYEEAKLLLIFKINGKLVREIANDDPVFAEGGDAWHLDNVDEAFARHDMEKAFEERKAEKTGEAHEEA